MIATSQLEQDLYRSVTNVQFADYGSAARAFVSAYKRFAAQVMSGTGGRATNVEGGAAQLQAVLLSAYAAQSLMGTASALAMGLLAFWQMQPWAGGVGPGQTTAPGHAGVDQMLAQLYQSGIGVGQATHHARELARICSVGVRQVIITEYPPAQPPKVTTAV